MAYKHALILNSGGLRSLVATALTLKDAPRTRASLLYCMDGRDSLVARTKHLRQQSKYFDIPRIIELNLSHIYDHGFGKKPDGSPMGTLINPQFLLAALAQARYLQAEVVIWPCAYNQDFNAISKTLETILHVEQLAALESVPMPQIQTPLLELSDRQIIELGVQLKTPFQYAYSCLTQNPNPCRACTSCVRRKQAFKEAGIIDPSFNPDTFSIVK